MNCIPWRTIGATLAAAGIIALWVGGNRLVSLETRVDFAADRIEAIAKSHNERLLFLERERRASFGILR